MDLYVFAVVQDSCFLDGSGSDIHYIASPAGGAEAHLFRLDSSTDVREDSGAPCLYVAHLQQEGGDDQLMSKKGNINQEVMLRRELT